MNMKSIYSNPYKYAVKCNIPFDLAKIMCLKQRHFDKEERKHRMYCPVCKSKIWSLREVRMRKDMMIL